MTRGKSLELRWNRPDETLFEALLSRGDRRLGPVLLRAWQLGARFDGWQEHFDLDRWRSALAESGLSLGFYTHRPRPVSEVLPWDHIDVGVRREYLEAEYQNSLAGETRDDCRSECVVCGILTAFRQQRRDLPTGSWQCP